MVRITLTHRTTRTRDETSDATMGHHGSLEPRCTLFYYDPPDKLADFLECAGSWQHAVLEVIVGAHALEGVELHGVMGFHVHPATRAVVKRSDERRSALGMRCHSRTGQ